MGFFSGIGSFLSGCIEVISSVSDKIGAFLSTASTSLLKVAIPYLGTLSTIVQVISTLLNILKPEDKIDELGDRAINSDKKLEDFDTTQEYINYLKNDVEFDKDEFDKLSQEAKTVRTAIGTSIVMKAINEKKGFEISTDTWVTLSKLAEKGIIKETKPEEFNTILNTFKDKQTDLNDYVKGELDPTRELEVGDKLVELYQELEPNLSKDEIEKKVIQMEIGG
jgi:hypothetical protein